MTKIAIAIGLILTIILAIAYVVTEKEKLPYTKKQYLLNIAERKFYQWLITVLPPEYIVFPQMVISNIVKVHTDKTKDFWKYQNKINRKTLDFVIFTRDKLQPVMAIEYDGKTHQLPERTERDLFVDKILETAGIGILHIRHEKFMDYRNIKKQILQSLKQYSPQ